MYVIACKYCRSTDLATGKESQFRCNACGKELMMWETVFLRVDNPSQLEWKEPKDGIAEDK